MQLDRLLCYFVVNVREQDGTAFEPSTLTSFQRSFGRHLHDLGKPYCPFNGKEFAKSRATLESKRKQLRQQGKRRRPKKALGLNEDEMEKLNKSTWRPLSRSPFPYSVAQQHNALWFEGKRLTPESPVERIWVSKGRRRRQKEVHYLAHREAPKQEVEAESLVPKDTSIHVIMPPAQRNVL